MFEQNVNTDTCEADLVVKIVALQGPKGDKGADGNAGYTPVKGIDYWTEEDKQDIKKYVSESSEMPAPEKIPSQSEDPFPVGKVLGVEWDPDDPMTPRWELVDPKDMEAVRFVSQTLNVNQQAQVRSNIGAVSASDVEECIDNRIVSIERKNCFVEDGGASLAIYNVKVVGTKKGIFITDIRNNQGFSGCFVSYGDPARSYAENMNMPRAQIVFSTLTGHIQKELDGFTLSFDYDISCIEEGTKLTAKYDNTTFVSSDCYYPIDLPYASLAMFEKIGIVGDSFASGEIYVENDDGTYTGKDYYNLSWGQILARKNGISVTNFSKGGLDTRDWLTHEKGLPLMQSTEAQNLYILALGINDIGNGTDQLGTTADITADHANNPDTFYGNYARIIEQIKAHAPNAKIIISTMAGVTTNHYSFNTAIKNIAKHYGIPYIEQQRDDFFLSSFYKSNQVHYHPTAAVYAGMALALERLIIGCITSNHDYFKDYVG